MTDQHLGVTTTELSVSYGDTLAVDAVSFSVEPGTVFGLLGPNGAGKTSVIRALTTIVSPAGGAAFVGGYGLADRTEIRRRIGVLPESNGYPGGQTSIRYLSYYGELHGLSGREARERALRLLERFGLASVMHKPIRTFSRGMRQRLGMARALVSDPAVLFLDEPAIGLDPAGREDMLSSLVSLSRDSKAAVVVCSHLLDDMERICDLVGIMNGGRLIASGSVDDVATASGLGAVATVEVPASQTREVVALLEASSLDCSPSSDALRPREVRIQFPETTDSANGLAALLIDQGVSILRIELTTARLSDAFLALTEGAAS